MQEFGVNAMYLGYNVRKYEKEEERVERVEREKPMVESERYHI